MSLLRYLALSRFSLKLTVAIFLSISLLTACSSNPPDTSNVWKVCESGLEKTVTENKTIPTTEHLAVYLDTSLSMAGYVSPDGGKSFAIAPEGQTIFSKTLLDLRSVVTTLSPQSAVVVRRVSGDVSAPSFSNLELSQAAINRATFNGQETNLAGAIKLFTEPLDKDDEEKKSPRFHILVTDGVQSSKQQNKTNDCEKGSDSTCVNAQIDKLLKKGWGATIIGLKSEFQGKVYSELNGSTIQYSSGKDPNKFRPFYLYIFSPDPKALTELTEILRKRLREIVKTDDAFREFALTSSYEKDVTAIELENLGKDYIDLKKVKVKDGSPPRLTIAVDVRTERTGVQKALLKVKVPWSENTTFAGTPNEMLSLVKWSLEPIEADKELKNVRYPNLKLVSQEIKDGAVDLTFETGWTKEAGDLGERMFRLVGKLDTDQSVLPWVKQWSTTTDTTAEVANKTLNLEGSFGNLWRNGTFQNKVVGGGCIRVSQR